MLKINPIIENDLMNITKEDISWEKLKGSTVLITGASGMIASYICWTFLYLNDTRELGIKVIALVRNQKKAEKKFSNLLTRGDFELLVQDVCEPINYKESIDYIIHAASQTSPRQFTFDPVGTIKANTIGTINLLDLALDKNVKGFMCLSTREIYGTSVSGEDFITENEFGIIDPTLVRSCYPEGKRVTETLCSAYNHQYGLNCKTARIAHTYGPGMVIRDGRVVGDFIGNVIDGEDIVMNSDGNSLLGLTYISDLITGLFKLLLEFNNPIYNISSMDSILSVRELASKLSSIFPEKNIDVLYKEASTNEKLGYLSNRVPLLNSSKAIKDGWKPIVDIEEGLKRTVAFFENLKEINNDK